MGSYTKLTYHVVSGTKRHQIEFDARYLFETEHQG